MKQFLTILTLSAAAFTATAVNPVVMGSSIHLEKAPMVLGDPVVGISGAEGDIHASHGKIQGLIEVVDISGVDEVMASVAFKIYPNPTVDILNIDCDSELYNAISLIDMNGALRLAMPISEEHTSISLGDLPAGVYLLSISSHDGKSPVTAKIIKH